MEQKTVTIELRSTEALVFFAWLSRLNESGSTAFEDQAEKRVLWDLEASLEKLLAAPLQGDYRDALREAREDVRDPE
jgi:hypothetical protein